MNSEIIQNVAYDNYDDFQKWQLHISPNFHFTILRIILMTKLTFGVRVSYHKVVRTVSP
jgi:hypothetical protein